MRPPLPGWYHIKVCRCVQYMSKYIDINQDKYTFTVSDDLKDEFKLIRKNEVGNNNHFSIYNKKFQLIKNIELT